MVCFFTGITFFVDGLGVLTVVFADVPLFVADAASTGVETASMTRIPVEAIAIFLRFILNLI